MYDDANANDWQEGACVNTVTVCIHQLVRATNKQLLTTVYRPSMVPPFASVENGMNHTDFRHEKYASKMLNFKSSEQNFEL